ncbi:MAG: iron-containing alcohol dehydrogenase [Anaerolineae bacterium]|nr:iron-containing alcohol dehydrogenase [Anaerolineae bacterium]
MEFEFATAGRIVFGMGKSQDVGLYTKIYGTSALILSGGQNFVDFLSKSLDDHGVRYEVVRIQGEPTVPMIMDLLDQTRSFHYDVVIGIGGGSVLDAGKAVSALRANPGNILDYLEVVGSNKPLLFPPVPYIAIPTTSGTGSEVTRNAVLGVPAEKVKVSLRSPLMLPKIALIDPELTLSVPPEVTASTGLDALAQVIEPFLCTRSNWMVDLYCREGMTRASRSLRTSYADGSNIAARTDMAWTSLLGGLSLANAGLGAVHGFAGPIGGMFDAPHGMICARLLPIVFAHNAIVIAKQNHSPYLARVQEVSRILCGNNDAVISDGVRWLTEIVKDLNVPGLSHYGVRELDIPIIVEKARNASSMKANPVQLPVEILEEILTEAL